MENLQDHIKKLREDFTKGKLSEADVAGNPFEQFEGWLKQALQAGIEEVQAMTLATVSAQGRPSSRIVYLREFENNQFWFYGNYYSRKAKDLEANPVAALSFFWPSLERQIRIEGTVERCSEVYSDNYFNGRPYESKIGSWASMQSSEIDSRETLMKKVEELKQRMPPEKIKRPEYWGGWVLTAHYYEFWQGRPSRLHDRIVYERQDENWRIKRISP